MADNLFWHYLVHEDDYPEDMRVCFLKVKAPTTIILGFRRNNEWQSNLYGKLPVCYDDSGCVYHTEIEAWAYIPDNLVNEIMYERCTAYRPHWYGDRPFCIGIKEPDECTCEGNKYKCNYY